MFQGQILSGKMTPRQLLTNTDGLTLTLTLEIWPYLCLSIIGSPQQEMNFVNPVVDIAAPSQVGVLIWLAGKLGLGCSLTDWKFRITYLAMPNI